MGALHHGTVSHPPDALVSHTFLSGHSFTARKPSSCTMSPTPMAEHTSRKAASPDSVRGSSRDASETAALEMDLVRLENSRMATSALHSVPPATAFTGSAAARRCLRTLESALLPACFFRPCVDCLAITRSSM